VNDPLPDFMTRERFAVIVIATHLAAAILHGVAHEVPAVPVGVHAGPLVIAAAVFVGPLVALAGVLGGRRTAGALVLSVSMAVALAYGVTSHYALRTPAHAPGPGAASSGPMPRSSRSSWPAGSPLV
jgi:hypothetical protein